MDSIDRFLTSKERQWMRCTILRNKKRYTGELNIKEKTLYLNDGKTIILNFGGYMHV